MKTFSFLYFILLISNVASAQDSSRYKEFFSDGKLKSINHQGYFNGCGMPVGTDSVFYQTGQLFSTIFYDNKKSKKEAGCHEGYTVEWIKTYFRSGKLKSTSSVKHGYEGAPCNCGTWVLYNGKGAIVKIRKHSRCYNERFDCD